MQIFLLLVDNHCELNVNTVLMTIIAIPAIPVITASILSRKAKIKFSIALTLSPFFVACWACSKQNHLLCKPPNEGCIHSYNCIVCSTCLSLTCTVTKCMYYMKVLILCMWILTLRLKTSASMPKHQAQQDMIVITENITIPVEEMPHIVISS